MQAASSTKISVFCLAYTHVSHPTVTVSSSAAESMSTILYLGRMEKDSNIFFLPNPFCFCLVYCYISLSLIVPMCAYSRMDFGVKTSGRMFSDLVRIQLNTNPYSKFTALRRAHVIIADFRPKLTGVFYSLNLYFHP